MRFLVVLVLMLAASSVGCDSATRREPTPASASASAHDDAAQGVRVERDRVIVDGKAVPDEGGAIGRAQIKIVLERRREGPPVAVPLALAADAPYARLRAVVDVLFELGLEGALDVGKGGPQPAERPKAATGDVDPDPILVLSVSRDAIYLGATEVARLAEIPPGDDIPALAAAIGQLAQRPARVFLHADDATPGAVIVRVIGTARRAGIADVSFTMRIAEEPRQKPQRAPAAPPH